MQEGLIKTNQRAPIMLSDIWHISEQGQFKVHFGRANEVEEPLEAWVRDPENWRGWQEYRPSRDEFNRPYIFSLINYYHERDIWLFGGVFRVVGRHPSHYEVEWSDLGAPFVGRLKLWSDYRGRSTRVNFENHYLSLVVQELLREPYAGRDFPGYENIDLSFSELEALVRNQRRDWRAALESVKGVYLITDQQTGRRYVGSAYGDAGVWSRWEQYVFTGHGGNAELRELVSDPSLEYCRQHFRFALLEHRPARVPDETVLDREAFWKRVLLSRGGEGLNRN